jgi:SAM-dependent methyltransferase
VADQGDNEVTMTDKSYLRIVSYCESFLEKYGDNYLGVGWTKKQEYAEFRYRVMLEVVRDSRARNISLLDFGCGASHLYEYLLKHDLGNFEYAGLDLSAKFLELSRRKFPANTYYDVDILEQPFDLPSFDYVILNGVFNSKLTMSFEEMFTYFQRIVIAAFAKARIGIAFNVMSKQVEWERNDLFHLPFDRLADFLAKDVSRHFLIRHDYGLYEYTTYVYKQALSS